MNRLRTIQRKSQGHPRGPQIIPCDLRISHDEQVEFLRKMYYNELGISQRSFQIIKVEGETSFYLSK